MPSKGPDTHVLDKRLRDRDRETQTSYTGMLPSPALQGSHAARASDLREQVGDAEPLGNGSRRRDAGPWGLCSPLGQRPPQPGRPPPAAVAPQQHALGRPAHLGTRRGGSRAAHGPMGTGLGGPRSFQGAKLPAGSRRQPSPQAEANQLAEPASCRPLCGDLANGLSFSALVTRVPRSFSADQWEQSKPQPRCRQPGNRAFQPERGCRGPRP